MEHVDGVVVTYSGVEHVVNVERLEELVVVRELCLSYYDRGISHFILCTLPHVVGRKISGHDVLISHPYNSLVVSTANAEDEKEGLAASPDRVWLGRARPQSDVEWPWSFRQHS